MHVAELDITHHLAQYLGVGRIEYRRLLVDQHEDALGGGHGSLHDIVLLGEVADRLEGTLGVLKERYQHAKLQGPLKHASRTVPEQERHRQRREEADHWEEDREDFERIDIGVTQAAIQLIELP